MLKQALLFILIALQCTAAKGQQKEIEALKQTIASTLHDTAKLAALKNLLDYLPQSEVEAYNLEMIALAEKSLQKTNKKLEKIIQKFAAEGYYNKGVFLSNKSLTDSALLAYKTAIGIYSKCDDEESVAYPKMNMAIIYTTKGDFNTALSLLYEALKINEKYKNKEAVADCNIHLSRLYHIQKMEAKALASATVAYNLYKEIGYNPGIIDALHKLSTIAIGQNDTAASISYLKANVAFINSLDKAEKERYLQTYYTDKANIAYRENNWDSSIYYNKKSVELSIQNNNLYVIGTRYLSIAEAYKAKKDYTGALSYASKAYDLGIKNDNLASQVACTYFLSNLYPQLQDYKKAFEMQSQFITLSDSVQKIENRKNTIEQQLKYDFEKKEITNASIQAEKNTRKNMIIAIAFGLFLITGMATFLIVKNQKQKNIIQKQLIDHHKQKAMLAQMNPHFIFNAINSIQNFVLHNKDDEAYSYLTKFSKLIRTILHNSNEDLVTLSSELETINLYISLEQLRFSNSFEYKLTLADDIDPENTEIPTMLLQPYVENAIWHGLMNLKEHQNAVLKIDASINNHLLKIVIEDNGVGREAAALHKKESIHNPIAMKLTAERLEMLKMSMANNGIRLEINDLYSAAQRPCGTKVIMHLPLIT